MSLWFAIPLGAGIIAVLVTLMSRTSSDTSLHIDH